MSNTDVNNLRQLLCLPDTPANRSAICAACLSDMMWDMAEASLPGLKAWADRQREIATALERHSNRHTEVAVYKECRFSMKDLSDANLFCANLRWTDLNGANLRGANLFGADLRGADLFGANLSDANLRWTDLFGANLSDANLNGANLFGANLSDANLNGANLNGANLRGANLNGATYNQHTLFPDGFDPVARGVVEVDE